MLTEPVHTPAWHVSVCVQASPSSHVVPFGRLRSAGQLPLEPVQSSSASHWSSAPRQTFVAGSKMHSLVQHDPAVPFAAPWSQSSPGSIVPSPHDVKEPNGHVAARFDGRCAAESPVSPEAALYSICASVPVTKCTVTVSFSRSPLGTLTSAGRLVSGVVQSAAPPAGTTTIDDAAVVTIGSSVAVSAS